MLRRGTSYTTWFFTDINLFSFKTSNDLPTVETVDIEKVARHWYEIARLPNKFEKGLECVSATYSVKENGEIEVVNDGMKLAYIIAVRLRPTQVISNFVSLDQDCY